MLGFVSSGWQGFIFRGRPGVPALKHVLLLCVCSVVLGFMTSGFLGLGLQVFRVWGLGQFRACSSCGARCVCLPCLVASSLAAALLGCDGLLLIDGDEVEKRVLFSTFRASRTA